MQASEDFGPDPSRAADLTEFITALNEYRVWAGAPSYRALARKVGPLLKSRQVVSQSTIGDAFQANRKRLNLDLVVAIVRALGADETTVARWRSACVAVQAGEKYGGPIGVFKQLPRSPAVFTGRDRELAEILQATASPANTTAKTLVHAIEGMGGIGKTHLALQTAHTLVQSGRYGDIQLYVNLYGFDSERTPATPADVLGGFLRALGVPVQHIPGAPGERAAMFRDRLQGRQALILLDNAADEAQVRDLIPSDPSCLVLITSRRSLAGLGLEGARVHELDTLPVDDTVELLAAIVGRDRIAAEPRAAARVAQLCGGLPLAAALAAARLRARTSWSVADLAEHLTTGGLDAVSAGGRSLRPVLDLSYSGLAQSARTMFRLLGRHPGNDFTPQTAAALAGTDVAATRRLLEHLQDEHLLQQKPFGRYSLHDLMREYARSLTPEQPHETETAAVGFSRGTCTTTTAPAASSIPGPTRWSANSQ